jgi:hypothetical protein
MEISTCIKPDCLIFQEAVALLEMMIKSASSVFLQAPKDRKQNKQA